jgi:hypothetical protein
LFVYFFCERGGLKLGYCWAIQTRVREFVISCDTKEARDEWIAASFANSELVIEETHDNPLQSIATLRKLLLPPEQMRKELESAADSAGPTAGKTPLVIPPLSLLSGTHQPLQLALCLILCVDICLLKEDIFCFINYKLNNCRNQLLLL